MGLSLKIVLCAIVCELMEYSQISNPPCVYRISVRTMFGCRTRRDPSTHLLFRIRQEREIKILVNRMYDFEWVYKKMPMINIKKLLRHPPARSLYAI